MSRNSFGEVFRITTWGESHGKAVGVVIDGCPSGVPLSEDMVNEELKRRAPGRRPHTSARKEPDRAEIYSGLYEGVTTGTPISIIIPNRDARPQEYDTLKNLLRPGHANYTYYKKYGIFDHRGGGRSSARETAARTAAGAVAKQFLKGCQICIESCLTHVGGETDPKKIEALLQEMEEQGDSLGGIVSVSVLGLPVGWGDPLFQKIEAKLAHAMLSLPATKGFEMGVGFAAASMKGSEHNDLFFCDEGKMRTRTNHSGGTLGGITTGMPLHFRVAFKPTSSIRKPQPTVTWSGDPVLHSLPEGARHDPCLALRAPPIVEAMTALVLADACLMHRLVRC